MATWKYKTGYKDDLNPDLKQAAITPEEQAAYDKQVIAYSQLGGMKDAKGYTDAYHNFDDVHSSFKAMAAGGLTEDSIQQQKTIDIARDASIGDSSIRTGGQYANQGDQILVDPHAEARSNVWGASGITQGRSFFETVAGLTSDQIDTLGYSNEYMLDKFYTSGLGREADAQGSAYHLGELQGGKSIQEVAQNFLLSEEAGTKDVYSNLLQRDVDDKGMQYHLGEGTGGVDASDNALRAVLSSEEYKARQAKAEHTGIGGTLQQSIQDFQNTGFYTHQRGGGYADLDWTGYGKEGYDSSVNMKEASLYGMAEDVEKLKGGIKDGQGGYDLAKYTQEQMTIGSILNAYADAHPNRDDGGEGGISQLPTFGQIQQHMKDGTSPTDITGDLRNQPWSLYNTQLEDGPGMYPDDEGPGGPEQGPGDDLPPQDEPIPEPQPEPEPEDDFDPTPEDHSNYTDTKTEFDNTLGGIDTSPQFDMGIRSSAYSKAGASAKGVRLKRSKKFKSGESSLGTKQLGRQLQIQSLNI